MIEVKNICKKYGRKQVLKNLSFTIEQGLITCLLGINGIGKSTTLQAIMGVTPIDAGEILLDGKKIRSNLYNKIAYVPDTQIMFYNMTILESFDYMEDYYDNWDRKKATELMEYFRLQRSMKINELSKGTTAKLNLILALAQDFEYIIMDEPFSGIDLVSRELIRNLFTSDIFEGKGVLLTTHEVEEFEHLIDKVLVLDNGNITLSFDTEELREKEGKSVVDVLKEVYLHA